VSMFFTVNNMQGLNAKNMYNGCNLLRVDFSKLSELSVRFNNDKTRDFTNPLLPSGDSQTAPNTAVGDQRSVAAARALAQQGTDHYYTDLQHRSSAQRTAMARASVSGRMDVYYAQKIAKYVQNPEVDV